MILEKILSSKTSLKVINYFLAKPWERHYLREICRRLGTNLNSTSDTLRKFASAGLLEKEKIGKIIMFYINKDSSLAKKLLELYHESRLEGLNDEFKIYVKRFRRKALDVFGDNLTSVILFGSVAKEKTHRFSDVDVLIVTKKKLKEDRRLENLFRPYKRYVQFVYHTEKEFSEQYSEGDEFILNILQNGIIIYDKDFYYSYLFRNLPEPTKQTIERKLDDIRKGVDEVWEFYRTNKEKSILISSTYSILYISVRKLAISMLLLDSILPESTKAISRQLSDIGENKLAKLFERAKKYWDGSIDEKENGEELENDLKFIENKLNETYIKLENFKWNISK